MNQRLKDMTQDEFNEVYSKGLVVMSYDGDRWVQKFAHWPVKTNDQGWIWRKFYHQFEGFRVRSADIYNSYSGIIPLVRVINSESAIISEYGRYRYGKML